MPSRTQENNKQDQADHADASMRVSRSLRPHARTLRHPRPKSSVAHRRDRFPNPAKFLDTADKIEVGGSSQFRHIHRVLRQTVRRETLLIVDLADKSFE
jgi:hypothetical protein